VRNSFELKAVPRIDSATGPFKFNPNLLPFEDLRKLGFSMRIAQRIVKFRESGGSFKVGLDLGKIYGINSALLIKLIPYVRIPDAPFVYRQQKVN
jgi:competence protein ComEA